MPAYQDPFDPRFTPEQRAQIVANIMAEYQRSEAERKMNAKRQAQVDLERVLQEASKSFHARREAKAAADAAEAKAKVVAEAAAAPVPPVAPVEPAPPSQQDRLAIAQQALTGMTFAELGAFLISLAPGLTANETAIREKAIAATHLETAALWLIRADVKARG